MHRPHPWLSSCQRLAARAVAVAAALAVSGQAWADEATPYRLDRSAAARSAASPDILLGTATAFVVAPGLLITNEHVVRGHDRLALRDVDNDGRVYAKVLARDAASDLALLQAEVSARPLPLNDGYVLAVNDAVAVIGFPDPNAYGPGRKLAKGTVREVAAPERPELFTMAVEVRGGNSGSPILAPSGQVIGVVTGGFVAPVVLDGVTYSTPREGTGIRLDKLLPFLDKYKVPYQSFAYRGSVEEIAATVAPAVFLLEILVK